MSFSQMMVHPIALTSSANISLISVPPKVVTSLDSAIRDDLQRFSHSFFVWVLISAFVVAIGVALEGPELLHEMWPKLFTCFTRESVPRLRKFKRIVKKVGFWGWLLVVVGVAGEGIFEALQNRAEGQLQTFNEILLADTQKQAGDAYERAAYAREEADSFQSQIADATARTKEAEAKMAMADARIAEAQKGAADATATAEREKLEEEQLELLVGPRRLTLGQQEKIGRACAGMNRGLVQVGPYGMDSEGRALAIQIGSAIFDHTFPVSIELNGPVTSGALDEGVLINGPETAKKFMGCLADALVTIGRLKEVRVNGERHIGTSINGGATMYGSTMYGGSKTTEPGPLPAGSPIRIFVGVKPIELLELKK